MENKDLSEQMTEILNGLTDEQKEKVKACKDTNELVAKLGEMGVALPDELLDAAAGGAGDTLFETLLASELGIHLSVPEPSLPVDPY